ncbi:MAG: hypothetical protein RL373_1467 [Pseudomonadota bacterium]|jgi:nitrilase
MKIASIQMVSSCSLEQNLAVATKFVQEAAQAGSVLVVLPEYFCLLGKADEDKLKIQESFGSGPIQDHLSKLALQNHVFLVAGTVPLASDNPNRVWNATLVFSPQGQVIARYDKIHLFSFSAGAESYDESITLQKGSTCTTWDIQHGNDSWKFGLSICYDIRFPEQYRSMGTIDCHIIPAAFTYTTGQDHWEILLRARAIENQSYVVASAQGGTHENGRKTWGHSMVIDPWGKIITELAQGEGVIYSELQKKQIIDIRTKLPALLHR